MISNMLLGSMCLAFEVAMKVWKLRRMAELGNMPGTFWPAHTEREVPMLLTANKSDRIRVYTRVYVNV